jgi:anti-sigma-K factor RskA
VSDIHSLAGEYVLGSLTESETEEFESHLATCPDCREEVAEMRDIAVQLSDAVATDPPPSLRVAVLDQIAHTAQDPVPARDDASPVEVSGRHLVEGSTASNVVPMQRSLQRRSRTAGLLAAAAVLAAIAMGGWAVHSRSEARDATAQAQTLTSVLAANDVRTVSGDFGSGGDGTVVLSRSQGKALLVAADLPALPSGKVYEAWTIKDTPPVAAGTFSADASQTVVKLPPTAVDADQVAVTVEQAGGSDHPTTDPVFVVKIPRA